MLFRFFIPCSSFLLGLLSLCPPSPLTLPSFLAGGDVTTLAGSGSFAFGAFADGNGAAASFNLPTGVSVRESTGVVYVADLSNYRIRAIAPGAAHVPQTENTFPAPLAFLN